MFYFFYKNLNQFLACDNRTYSRKMYRPWIYENMYNFYSPIEKESGTHTVLLFNILNVCFGLSYMDSRLGSRRTKEKTPTHSFTFGDTI